MNESVTRVDPWAAFGRIVGGVGVYGLLGFGLDQWWDTTFMVGLGIVAGAALGVYTVLATLRTDMTPAASSVPDDRAMDEG